MRRDAENSNGLQTWGVCVGKASLPAGQLTYAKQGQREYSAFAYGAEWLGSPGRFEISPDLPTAYAHKPQARVGLQVFGCLQQGGQGVGWRVQARIHQDKPARRHMALAKWVLCVRHVVAHGGGVGHVHLRYHGLISAFWGLTGVPMVLNTSIYENKPMVCKTEEALDCFLRTKMDVRVMGKWVVRRQPAGLVS